MEAAGAMMMNPLERSSLDAEVNFFNKSVSQGKTTGQEMGKNEFLKILLTQLQHQDPTKPMEDKEFIAQMAQFSSLEQMTNMAEGFTTLSNRMQSAQAVSLLGKNVEVVSGGQLVSGKVDAVTGGDFPQVMIGGQMYDYAAVTKVKNSEGEPTL